MSDGAPEAAGRLVVPRAYNGPAHSAQGGVVCGLLAARTLPGRYGSGVVVTLHAPPPLETELEVRPAGPRAALYQRERLLAVAAAGRRELPPPPPWVPPASARRAAEGFTGVRGHPFPDCFACGPRRTDGLGLRPGPVPGMPGTVACPWVPVGPCGRPGGAVPPELVWAALDCPGGWADDPVRRPMVLQRMSARIDALPTAGEACTLVGRVTGRRARTTENTTALYDPSGRLLARAAATWAALAAYNSPAPAAGPARTEASRCGPPISAEGTPA
ncbi:hypothetical protein [Streptomyces qinglanensis]|uniref:hypothetical protein n=1 Tax=Streptomyces qinglanensis TaxID=943816 RepID=UPI00378A06BA